MRVTWLNAVQAKERLEELMRLAGELKDAPQWSRAQWEAVVESMKGAGERGLRRGVVVAEESERLVGFLVVATVAGEAEIESIAVRSECQGRGIGRALLNLMVDIFLMQGIAHVQLEVRESNERAIGFYRALGFAVEGRRAGYYQEPAEDAVLYCRAVSRADS